MAEEINNDPMGPGGPASGEHFVVKPTETPATLSVDTQGGNMVGGQFMASTELKRLAEEPLDWGAVFMDVKPPTTGKLFQFKEILNDFIAATDYFPTFSDPQPEINTALQLSSLSRYKENTTLLLDGMANFLGYANMADLKAKNPPEASTAGESNQVAPPPTPPET